MCVFFVFFFFSSRRRHTRFSRDWSSDVCSSDLYTRRTCSRWRRPRMRIRSRQSARSVRTQRSAWAFAFGAWIGVRITLMRPVRKTSSKAGLNFIAVVHEEPEGVLVAELHEKVARLLGRPAPVGIRGGGDVLDPPRRERDEEQHVDSLQEGGLNSEEVASKHASCLRAQKRAPRRLAPLRRWLHSSFEQHLAYRGRTHRDAQALEFADDTFVAPVRVLVAKPQDQSAQRRLQRRPTVWPARIRPAPSDQLAVPAQQ